MEGSKKTELLSYVAVLLGVLVCGCAWGLAVAHVWPLVLFAGIDLLIIGAALGTVRIVELYEQTQESKRKAVQRLIGGSSD